MNPRQASAHTLCIAERRSRSSRVRGTMKLMPTRSPVVGEGKVIVSTRSGRCWRSYSAASECAAFAVRGCVVGSSTSSPSTHIAGGCDRKPLEHLLSGSCSHVASPCVICSIIETMIRMSNDTIAPSQTLDRGLAVLGLRRRRRSSGVGRCHRRGPRSASIDRLPVAAHAGVAAPGRAQCRRRLPARAVPGRAQPSRSDGRCVPPPRPCSPTSPKSCR